MSTEKLFYTNYFCPETLQVVIAADFSGVKLELTQINKKNDSVNLLTKQGILNKSNAILRYLTTGTALNGSTSYQRNQLNIWFQYFNTQLQPVLSELYDQIFGQKPANETKYTYCLNQVNKNLKVLDDSLKIKTFFVGNNITVFDITLATYLESLFKLIIAEGQRKKLNNLVRWYHYVRSIPVFTKYLGKSILCGKDSFKIEFKTQERSQILTQVKTQTKVQLKAQIKSQPKKQQKKVENKPQQKIQAKHSASQVESKQQSNGFKLDDFKRQFQNSQNQVQVLTNLLNTLNQEKFSIWKIHYDKDPSQGKVLYLTQNLANGSLQRLETIRKVAFGTWGVYGQEGNYEIRGLMIWEGTQISPAWKQHPAFEYHKFTKLSPQNQQDRKLITDYIMQAESVQGLILRYAKRVL